MEGEGGAAQAGMRLDGVLQLGCVNPDLQAAHLCYCDPATSEDLLWGCGICTESNTHQDPFQPISM